MIRVIGAALLGAIVGGALLAAVAAVGPDPAVTIPIPQANGTTRPETISLASIVAKLAVILGVCTGALVGALAGAAASADALSNSGAPTSRPKRP